MTGRIAPWLCLLLAACDCGEAEGDAAPTLVETVAFDPDGGLWVALLSSPPVIERWPEDTGEPSRTVVLDGVEARVGAFEPHADGSAVVALAWPSARVPTHAVLTLSAQGDLEDRCEWRAELSSRWRPMPRGAASVVSLAGGGILVGGRDGSLVLFSPSCDATVLSERPFGLAELAVQVAVSETQDGEREVTAAPLGTLRGPPWALEPGPPPRCDVQLEGDELVVGPPGADPRWSVGLSDVRRRAGFGGPPGPLVADASCRRVAVVLGTRVAVCEPDVCRLRPTAGVDPVDQ